MWARGEGMRATSSGVSPWAVGHAVRLVGQAPVAVQHGLRVARRARGEQDHGHVGARGRCLRRCGGRPRSASNRGSPVRTPIDPVRTRRVGQRQARRRPGAPPGRARPGSARPRPSRPGGGSGWPPPRSASRRGRGRPPPTSWGAARPPRPGGGPRGPAGPRPPTRPAASSVAWSSTTSPSITAGARAGRGDRQQPVEPGYVPGPARAPVGGRIGLVVGGPEPHRSRPRPGCPRRRSRSTAIMPVSHASPVRPAGSPGRRATTLGPGRPAVPDAVGGTADAPVRPRYIRPVVDGR